MKKQASKKQAAKAAQPKAAPKATNVVVKAISDILKPAAPAAQPAEKPLVDLSKLTTKNLRIALNQETSMRPAVALAYREELAKRDSAAPKAPAAQPKAAKGAPAAPAAPKAAPTAFGIHINKTGRVCFLKDSAARLGMPQYVIIAVDNGVVRLQPSEKKIDGAVDVRKAGDRPYISATKQFKPLGFDGSRPYDIEAKPYGAAGFEFSLS